jgi:hypothetical protein
MLSAISKIIMRFFGQVNNWRDEKYKSNPDMMPA